MEEKHFSFTRSPGTSTKKISTKEIEVTLGGEQHAFH
jgi:hypothetical protein